MARNRTATDLFFALGTELIVLLLVVLAVCLSVSQYFSMARGRMRQMEFQVRRRAARRFAA